jgi:hypothetical protein
VQFIRGQQDPDGGFPEQDGAGSNAQSTAFAVQGLLAVGVDPGSLHRRGAPSPLDYLRSLIAGDGHVRYSRSTDQTPVWVTAEALPALDGKALPLASVARKSAPAPPRRATHSTTTHHPSATHASSPPAPRTRARPATRVSANSSLRPPELTLAALDRLAADAGILTALTLAPLGQG